MSKKKLGLTTRILIALFAGALLGVLFHYFEQADIGKLEDGSNFFKEALVNGVFSVVGEKWFIGALKMLVVPLVMVSLICGTAALDNLRKLGAISLKAVGLYLFTTALAISLAIFAALVVQPGVGTNFETETGYVGKEARSLVEVFGSFMPTNVFKAMAEGKMIQIIVFSILFGIAMTLSGKPGKRVLALCEDLNEVLMKLVTIVIHLAPYGVFALIVTTFGRLGYEAFAPMLKYFFLVIGVLLIHATVTYGTMLRVFGRLNPLIFYRKMREAQLFAFSTSSSNASIPVTMDSVERKLGVDNSIASFCVPLGATINMDGTAIMQGVATVFIAQVYGVDMSLVDILTVIGMITLASIGTAGVPGVGTLMLAMVLGQVGLPVEGIGLILGVDRLLDMTRTAVNITGDAMVSCVIARSEKQIDVDRFRDLKTDQADEQLSKELKEHS